MIRVASVPSAHPYVAHLTAPDPRPADPDRSIVRLPDPTPAGVTVAGQWWPPRYLDPVFLADHVADLDVLHVHFGFESASVTDLREVVAVLAEAERPLVLTVHDLHTPHDRDEAAHLARLDVLVPAASAVLTLTATAAVRILQRWGRMATVVPHPHLAPLDRIGRARPEHDGFVIGVHAKCLRANLDPVPVVEALAETIRTMPGTRLRVDLDDDVLDPTSHWFDPESAERLLELGQRPGVTTVVHPRFSDEQLWDYLEALDVAVLPYRFGTHSGWLELCVDLGTAVVAPGHGCYAGQHPVETFGFDRDSFASESLDAAVRRVHSSVPAADPHRRARRRAQRAAIAQAHTEVYRTVLTERRRATA